MGERHGADSPIGTQLRERKRIGGYRSVVWVLWSGKELRPLTGADPQRGGCGGEDAGGQCGDDHDNNVDVTHSWNESP